MQDRMITNIDSNLITLQYDRTSNQRVLKIDGHYIKDSDIERLETAKIIDNRVKQILSSLELTNLVEIKRLISHLKNKILSTNKLELSQLRYAGRNRQRC